MEFQPKSLVRITNTDHIWYDRIGTIIKRRGLFYIVSIPTIGNILLPAKWLELYNSRQNINE